jgi:hypothetical protein
MIRGNLNHKPATFLLYRVGLIVLPSPGQSVKAISDNQNRMIAIVLGVEPNNILHCIDSIFSIAYIKWAASSY